VTCCGEYGCQRRTPLVLYRGDLTGQVFLATSTRPVRDHDGRATFAATRKHDVTAQMRTFIRANPGWVRGILEAP
jgi:hypothetical protein